MGLKNLGDFRDVLDEILGRRGHTPAKLDNWIHDGYYDLTGAVDFQELNRTSTAVIAVGDNSVTLPTDMQWVRGPVRDVTDDSMLIYEDQTNFLGRDEDAVGIPSHWTRIGNTLRVWTTPEVATKIRLLYNIFPPRFVDESDVTVLPPTWDRVIEMYAAYHALLTLGENANATDWLSRAVAYQRSRLLSTEFETEGVSGGVWVAFTESDLTGLKT